VVLFSHPKDYTPVCTTELGRVAQLKPEFEKRGIKLIALSCDSVEDHNGWAKDISDYAGCGKLPYPIIADPTRELSIQFGMLDPDEKDGSGMPLSCRAFSCNLSHMNCLQVFVIDSTKKLKLSILYPATTGRNFDEILRAIDSLKLTVEQKVATPVDWKHGDKCMVIPSITTADAKKIFPKGVEIRAVPSGKEYLRFTPDPVH